MSSRSWIPYAALLVVFWGVWGAFSSLPTEQYGYPDEMVYILWSLTMLVPAFFILRSERTFDRRPIAAIYGLLIGLTGAGGQLVLFKALTIGPAYLIFPIVALSPGITVLMATFLLRERLLGLTKVGIVLALIALVFFNISGDAGDAAVADPGVADHAGLGRSGLLHAQGRHGRGKRRHDLRLHGAERPVVGPDRLFHDGRISRGCPLAGPDAHARHAALERGRRPVPRHGPEPRQGVDRGAHDQRPRAGADRPDLARRLPDAADHLRHPGYRAGHSRLDAHGLRG